MNIDIDEIMKVAHSGHYSIYLSLYNYIVIWRVLEAFLRGLSELSLWRAKTRPDTRPPIDDSKKYWKKNVTNRPTNQLIDQLTNQPIDTATCRVPCPELSRQAYQPSICYRAPNQFIIGEHE